MRRLVAGLVFMFPAAALAGPVPDDGISWISVGSPGNKGYDRTDPSGDITGRGGVSYRFRMSRSVITNRQWVDFLNAYAPHWAGDRNEGNLVGEWAYWDSSAQHYDVPKFARNWGTQVGWEFAARYANWMHNGRAANAAAFENGAYDTSTFYRSDDGIYHHQQAHNVDARYWLPTIDEMLKAAYYDPEKDGSGGWWTRPNRSDNDLIMALPQDGGETYGNIGLVSGDPDWWAGGWDVEQYLNTHSAFGLLDVSATTRTWTESMWYQDTRLRIIVGSEANLHGYEFYDLAWGISGGSVNLSAFGIRLASTIPSPGGFIVCTMIGVLHSGKRRRP